MTDTVLQPDAALARMEPRAVAAELRALIDSGVPLRPAGEAGDDPSVLLARQYLPTHKVELFDATYYVTDPKEDDDIGFVVGYVVLRPDGREPRAIWPRIFYKDLSLMWRVATHFVRTDDENWIGKGDIKWLEVDGEECSFSAEETANLPLEVQAAFDAVRGEHHPRRDLDAVPLVLRRAPEGRIEPYADFTRPRRAAMKRHRIHGNRPIARFARKGDPTSLAFVAGYEPDFTLGLVGTSRSRSQLYGGALRKYRILSTNRAIQYQFVVGPRHAWINPPQALTTELSTYGVRTVDVVAPEDLFVPGYEYHFVDEHEDPPCLHSQIPDGYAGAPSEIDPHRADASAWIEALPVMRAFRKTVLGSGRGSARR